MLEKDLWGHLRPLLQKGHFLFTRLENSARVGMSDVYMVTPSKVPIWVELKVHKRKIIGVADDTEVKIDWRPGQQYWGVSCMNYGQRAYTLVQFKDAYALIEMTCIREGNIVLVREMQLFWSLESVVNFFSLLKGGL